MTIKSYSVLTGKVKETLEDAPSFEPVLTEAEALAAQKEAFRAAVQAHVDATAQGREYESGFALASYVNSQHALWKAEADVFVLWRDSVWLMVFGVLEQVQAGDIPPPPNAEALIDVLPPIEWPVEQVS